MQQVTFLLFLVSSGSSYFTYYDCNPDCIHYNDSCTIVEINANYFINRCTVSEASCEENASQYQVCLRPGKEPLGGQHIWPDFAKHKHRPPAGIVDECAYWKITTIVFICLTTLIVVKPLFTLLLQWSRSRQYEQLAGQPNRDVYQETVEDIE